MKKKIKKDIFVMLSEEWGGHDKGDVGLLLTSKLPWLRNMHLEWVKPNGKKYATYIPKKYLIPAHVWPEI